MSRTKKHFRDVESVVGELFTDYDIVQGKKHIDIVVRHSGRARKITASSTPSCRHATNQLRRDMRKILHELTTGAESGSGWTKG